MNKRAWGWVLVIWGAGLTLVSLVKALQTGVWVIMPGLTPLAMIFGGWQLLVRNPRTATVGRWRPTHRFAVAIPPLLVDGTVS